jgi:hypothetical protein
MTHIELGKVFEMFTVNIQALLNSADDELQTSKKVCLRLLSHEHIILTV